MIEKKCEYCGKVMQLLPGQRDQKFCSRECYNNSRKLVVDTDFDWKKLRDGLYECRYHPGGQIGCTNRQCGTCGWNPEVEAARNEAIRKALEETKNKEEKYHGKESGPARSGENAVHR